MGFGSGRLKITLDSCRWIWGNAKEWLCEQMEGRLSVEDDYFAEDTLRQIEEPERWRAFLTACVAYACLVCYLNEAAVPLDID